MRTVLATLCAAVLALPAPARASVWAVEPAGPSAEQLYEEGRKDYRLGRFQEAIDKWEQAYDQAELPLLLYNIALAYRQLYDVSASVEDLRKGKVVLRNFLVIAERDPEVDPADAQKLMDELDELIANADKGEPDRPAVQAGPTDDKPVDPRPVPEGPDPGRKHRIIGGALMGGGGAVLLGGLVIGIVYGLEGSRWSDALGRAKDEDADARQSFVESGMGDPDENEAAYEEFSRGECTQSDGRTPADVPCSEVIATFRSNGQGANRVMALGLGLGGGLGLAAIVAGAVLFVQGNHRTRDWRAGSPVARSIRVGPAGLGLRVSGRF
jgi:tetratricopeptide (TPR) repeat protein